jgi:hypothetical protein
VELVIRTRIFVRKLVLPALLFIGILSSTVLDKVLTDQHKCAGARLGGYLLLPKVVSSSLLHVSTKLQKTIKSSNSCRIARLLYHSINGGSISVFTSHLKNPDWKEARIAMDAATANRLSAIAVEMGQVQNEIQERRRARNLFLRSFEAVDPERKEARMRATRERIEALEGRLQALRAEQQSLIVAAAHYGEKK